MKLSTKGRYAMVALADLALTPDDQLKSLAEISKRQDISLPYLEQLFVKLRRAGLVESMRGPGGGYRLAKPAADIRVSDILGAVDETVSAMHTGAGASGAVSGSKAQSLTNRLVGRAVGPCLCLPASDAAFGYRLERACALSGGSGAVRSGGRGVSGRKAFEGICKSLRRDLP